MKYRNNKKQMTEKGDSVEKSSQLNMFDLIDTGQYTIQGDPNNLAHYFCTP